MNLAKSTKIYWFSAALILLVTISFNTQLFCMAEVMEGAEMGIEGGLETGVRDAALEAAERAFGNAEELTAEDLSSMREGFQEDLKAEVTKALEGIKADLAKDPTIEIGSEDFKNIVENAFNEAKSNFLNNTLKSTEMSFEDVSALEKMKFNPEEMGAINKLPVEGFEMVNVPEGMAEVKPELPETSELSVAHDEVVTSQKELQDAYKTGNKSSIDAAETKLKQAQETYDTQAKATKEAASTKTETANRDVLEAQDTLEKANKSGNSEAIKNAKQEVAAKEEAAKTAKTEQEEIVKKQAKEQYDQAKASKATADAEAKTAEKVYGKDSEEFKAAQEKVTEAQKTVDAAKKNLLENTGYLENKGLRIAEAAKGAGGGLLGGTKSVTGWLWNTVGTSFLGGFIFNFGPMIMQTIENVAENKTKLDAQRAPQKFGGVNMKQPDWAINENDPSNSFFIYVGVPNPDQALTAEFLKTANYYVAKPDYGALGAYAIYDPNFPNVMLHLNTGFIFVGDGQPYDPDKPTMPLLQEGKEGNLINALNELAGRIMHGAEGKVYQYYIMDRSTGYKGDPDVGKLFETDKTTGYPPLLNATITALQNGTKFGKYSLQGIRGLGGTKKSNPDDQKMWQLIAGTGTPGADDEPYVAHGIYVYQTKDTPFIQTIRNAIAPDDPNQQAILKDLADYVVLLDENRSKIVPLQIPQSEPPYNYASYVLNDIEETGAKYMVSLLEKGGKLIPASGTPKYDAPTLDLKSIPNITADLITQIEKVQAFCQQNAVKGPFNYGSVKLTIDPALLEAETFIYKAPSYLSGGVDDYVVALKGSNAVQLPSDEAQLFVSLVTSRFYDTSFKPYQPPAYKNVPYHVATVAGNSKPFVTTGKLTSKMTEIYSGSAPLYTLFVEYPFNPNKPPAGTNVTSSQLSAAFYPYWALSNLKMGTDDKAPTINDYLTANNKTLLNQIKASHDAWIKTLDKTDPAFVSKQMGPFDFTTDLVQNVQLTAFSEDAIKNQNFVYVSDSYPDEFLIMSDDSQGSGSVGQAFGTQQYAISLSNGNVYDSKPQTESGKLSGNKIDQAPLNVDELLKKAQAASPYLPDLLKKIQDSQVVYNGTLRRNLFGPNVGFGRFKFYITKADYLAGQFIYADVTNLAAPLDDKENEVASVVANINDYYVCVVRTADSSQSDGYSYSFGDKLSGDTYSVVSLISGAAYDRTGKFIGSYEQFALKGTSITNVLEFTNNTLGVIAKKSGKPVRLMNTITKLTQTTYDNILKEEKELKKDEEDRKKIYTPLGSDLKANLDLTTNQYIDNPNELPRYIKKYQDRYYAVTPGYVTTTPPSKDTPLDTPGPDRTYIDYNYGDGSDSKDTGQGMIYDSKGNAQLLLTGWALANARAYAGILVDNKGKESRMMGMNTPRLPMARVKPVEDFMVPTKFPSKQAGGVNFDFYYHNQIDSYFVKVSPTTGQAYYINLTSGYGYNLDGTPRWFESPMFRDNNNNLLLVGTDAFDIRKVALQKPAAKGKPQEPYNFYTMVGSFKAQILQDYEAQGSYYEMINDIDPDQRIRLMLCDKNLQGVLLKTPFYLVWDVNGTTFNLIGRYDQDSTLRYSLVLYAQTRAKGAPVDSGSFIASDNYIDPSATNPKPKTVGILFDQNHKLKGVFYQNQICMLQGNSSSYLKSTNGTPSRQPITVTENHKVLQPQTAPDQPVMEAHWLTIDDGANSYDFLFDTLILNPNPQVSSGEISAANLNLYDLKHNLWKLNVSSVARNPDPTGKADLTKPSSRMALVSELNAVMSPGSVKFPPALAESLKSVPNQSAQNINVDNAGYMFIYNRVSGQVIRFAYQLGSQGSANDTNSAYYTDGLNGWYVDISNGVLYDSSGFPSGQSLLPSQLDALLDKLQLSVGYDCDPTTKICKPILQYRMLAKPTPKAARKR